MFRDCRKFVGLRFAFIPTQSTVRCSSRKDCAKVIEPRCDVKKPDICKGKELKLDQRLYIIPPKNTIWEYPFCCANFCADLSIRTDELYYKKTDMRKRDYQQTWISCPPLHVLDAEVCPPQNCIPREIIPRKKRIRSQDKEKVLPGVACPQELKKFKLMACQSRKPEVNRLCPKIPHDLPDCVTLRTKPLCKIYHPFPITCKKDPAPYPSFSECKREEASAPRPIECKCLERPAMCEVWEKFRQRLAWKHSRFERD